MPLPCSGIELPDLPKVAGRQPILALADCCALVAIDETVLLVEEQPGKPAYWIILHADATPLTVCHLEKYAEKAEKEGHWTGRRADYLALGWYQGDCWLTIIELRDILVNDKQCLDKLDQVEASITQLMAQWPKQIANEPMFNEACFQPEGYKIAGAVVAPAGIRAISREYRSRRLIRPTYSALITIIPTNRIHNCQLSWTTFMETFAPTTHHSK